MNICHNRYTTSVLFVWTIHGSINLPDTTTVIKVKNLFYIMRIFCGNFEIKGTFNNDKL